MRGRNGGGGRGESRGRIVSCCVCLCYGAEHLSVNILKWFLKYVNLVARVCIIYTSLLFVFFFCLIFAVFVKPCNFFLLSSVKHSLIIYTILVDENNYIHVST